MQSRTIVLALPISLLLVLLAGCASSPAASSASAPSPTWIRQFGTSQFDIAFGVSTDASGNSYAAGDTAGALPGQTSSGFDDVTLAKYGATGKQAWAVQFGSSANDVANSVATDANGNSYVAGYTGGTLPGQVTAGGTDAFLAKYDTSGKRVWLKQFGTAGSDIAESVAVGPGGGVYVTGDTSGAFSGSNAGGTDVFIAKYDASGTRLWLKQFGSAGNDRGLAVAANANGVAFAGTTTGNLSGTSAGKDDGFVAEYTASGNAQWIEQFGSSGNDDAMGVALDGSGNVFVTGGTSGSLGSNTNAGGYDVFLAKYDATGGRLWVDQFGTSKDEEGNAVATDANGNAYITGYASGRLGAASFGGQDVFLAKVNAGGGRAWVSQIGTSAADAGKAVAVDGSGNVVVGGFTGGTLGKTHLGNDDAFLARYAP